VPKAIPLHFQVRERGGARSERVMKGMPVSRCMRATSSASPCFRACSWRGVREHDDLGRDHGEERDVLGEVRDLAAGFRPFLPW